jgi:hypothetical protein
MSAAEGSTATVAQLMQRSLLDVFNERDAERRAAAIAAVYSADVTLYEPDDAIHGPAALGAKVQQLLDGAPGWVFRPAGKASVIHDLGRLTWHFGPEGGPGRGHRNGRRHRARWSDRSLYVFIHAPEEGSSP